MFQQRERCQRGRARTNLMRKGRTTCTQIVSYIYTNHRCSDFILLNSFKFVTYYEAQMNYYFVEVVHNLIDFNSKLSYFMAKYCTLLKQIRICNNENHRCLNWSWEYISLEYGCDTVIYSRQCVVMLSLTWCKVSN